MMRWLVQRELVVVARSTGTLTASAVHGVLLLAFMAVWGDGLPLADASSAFEQLASFDRVVLAILLPWAAIRSIAPASHSGLAAIALASGCSPGGLVVARVTALAASLLLVSATALPFLTVAQRVSAVGAGDAVITYAALVSLTLLATTMATASSLVFGNRVVAWITASVATLVVGSIAPEPARSGAALAAAVVVASAAARWAQVTPLYVEPGSPSSLEISGAVAEP